MDLLVKKFIILYHRVSPSTRRRLWILAGIIVFLHAVTGIGLWIASGGHPQLVALVVLAYGLGLRHAVDADHIAAIDNTTRKLMHEGKRPVAVGLFFSLGHSTIVILLSVLLAASASFVATNLPAFQAIGSKIGIAVSSLFLLMIGVINLMALLDIVHVWRHVMRGEVHDEKEIHHHLATSGVLARIFAPFLKAVSQSYHMYFVGFLFGLGFDTASEVGLLSISATTGATGVPIWETLLLPLAFTAGMAAIDTLDGVLMLGAYGWAYLKPVRKLYYNMNITLMSVIIALVIGGIEALQIMIEEFGWHGGIVDSIRSIDFGSFGYIIILAFVISWLFSAIVYRWKGYDNIRIGK